MNALFFDWGRSAALERYAEDRRPFSGAVCGGISGAAASPCVSMGLNQSSVAVVDEGTDSGGLGWLKLMTGATADSPALLIRLPTHGARSVHEREHVFVLIADLTRQAL